MKRPYPRPAADAPDGTVWFGGPIRWFSISLIIAGDDFSPDKVTALLGAEPTHAQRKGVPILRADGTVKRIPKFSSWVLKFTPRDTDEWDVSEAAKLLLSRLPDDPGVWHSLPLGAAARLCFGLELDTPNRGFELDPAVLRLAANRNIRLDFDI